MEIADNSIDLLGIVFIELKDLTAKKYKSWSGERWLSHETIIFRFEYR